MNEYRGKPSGWLLYNSMGYPDFLFTLLAYSMLLLVFTSLMWVTFGILAYLAIDSLKAQVLFRIMDSMQLGILALALVIVGLAISYTMRRYKKDEHYIMNKKLDQIAQMPNQRENSKPVQEGLTLVYDEEDI